MKLDEKQKEAVTSAFKNPITVISGPAGSGKSTICKCIVDIANDYGISVRLMAPTGKAAQVLSEKTNFPAMTIHRSLKMKPGDDKPNERIMEDIVIIDEISMCGIDTFYAIMSALIDNNRTKLVLVGDKNQLPSVSPGNFLNDIIKAECANIVFLEKIYRQDEKSYVPIIANDISKGKQVVIPNDASDIKWINIIQNRFKEDILRYLDNYLKENDIEDLQIISPMKKGEHGVYYTNEIMQEKMSEINKTQDKYIKIGFNKKYHLKDRVIQIENNYKKNVFNGDMGIIIELGEKALDPTVNDKKTRYILVKFLYDTVLYTGNEIDQLQLAWCITVHKFQGSSNKYIVFIMSNEAQIMATKELVYTAITRCSKKITIFGHQNTLSIAPTRSGVKKRYTNMQKFIKQEKENNKKIIQILE